MYCIVGDAFNSIIGDVRFASVMMHLEARAIASARQGLRLLSAGPLVLQIKLIAYEPPFLAHPGIVFAGGAAKLTALPKNSGVRRRNLQKRRPVEISRPGG